MAKEKSEFVKNLKLTKPNDMDYYVPLSNDKENHKFICRVEKLVRSSMEYRDYINFLKEHIGLDSCIFFQSIGGSGTKKSRVSIELHHEPFTLYDIVSAVLTKYKDEGLPINDLLIADEVMELHYANKVGLVPLSKTAHQVVHNSTKLFVPLNMVYGQYSQFLNEYDEYIKLEIYINKANNLKLYDYQEWNILGHYKNSKKSIITNNIYETMIKRAYTPVNIYILLFLIAKV